MAAVELQVIRPGLLTTVQDLGRWGQQAAGVPVAGPMDAWSHRLANALVGNAPDAATLEVTLIGPDLLFTGAVTIAICGADYDLSCDGRTLQRDAAVVLPAGSVVQFGRRRAGARAYVAVAGGIDVPLVLGSRATSLVSRMGGHEGRALVAGDRLPIGAAPVAAGTRRFPGLTLPASGRARLRVVPGPQAEWFEAQAFATLASVSFRISPRSNRMGYRLEGPPLPVRRRGEPISEPLAFGAIQVPPAGAPILLMADRQTAGGYPKIASVIAADLPLAGQLGPGDFIEFTLCTRQDALAALIARERPLLRASEREVVR